MPTRERRLQELAKRQRRPKRSPPPEGEAMARKPDLYYARRPFGYTDDLYVDQGQAVELAGAINDEKLTRLGYFELLHKDQELVECGECGAKFISPHFRDRHGDRQHRNRGRSGLELSPAGAGGFYADDAGEAEERRLEQEAPLYIEKSEASQR